MKITRSLISSREVAYHILFWLLYVASEYFANLMHIRPAFRVHFFQTVILTLPLLMLPTYFMAWYVVPRFLKSSNWLFFILWILAVAAILFYARIKWEELLGYLMNGEYYHIPVNKMLKNIIRDYSIIALAVCIYIIGDYKKKQKHNEQLIRAKAEAEIKLLKGQLHPHFLFNSLNNIYSLALVKSDLTADSILKLTELLEYLVYRANKEKVALLKEVELLHHYIDLEKLRHGEKLKIESDISVHKDSIQVAPLILLPFAENCFKHGGTGKDGLFHISIMLHTDDRKLIFQITNSKKKRKENEAEPGGVGLENIRQRLTLLYPNRHQLEIRDLEDTYFVRLEIKWSDEEI